MLSHLHAVDPRIALGVITNGEAEQQRQKLQVMGVEEYLPHVTVSSDVGVAKPDAAIFRAACEALKVNPNQAVYVGERVDVDAQAATDAGMHGIWLNRRDTSGPDIPQISTLVDLPHHILGV